METDFIQWLSERLPDHPNLHLGIGDDAAILAAGRRSRDSGQTVVTTDLLSDGVDFLLEEVDPQQVGRKALAVNLSDLAAMAASPLAVVIAIALPQQTRDSGALELAAAIYEGMLPLAEELDVAIAGGDTNMHVGPLVLSGTALGAVTPHGPLTRAGGQPGDRLLVTGDFGGSILGHHLNFVPRVTEALLLQEKYELQAGIDVSDGLGLDASRLAAASGCGARIDTDRIPIREAALQLSQPLEHALGDGEDFELLLAVSPAEAERILNDQPVDCGITDIGELIEQEGLWRHDRNGDLVPMAESGFVHGRSNFTSQT